MGRFVIANVEQAGDGRLYYRRRFRDANGRRVSQRIRLPDLASPDFADSLAQCQETAVIPVRKAVMPGSIAFLCQSFRADLPRRKTKRGPLSPRTIENYRRYADRIETEHGHRLMRQVKPKHIYLIQDALSEEPGVANNYISVLRLMLAMACRFGWVDSNAAAGIPALAIGEHEPWPARVLTAALAVATPMTRLALVTYLCSGQRGGDIIRMQHGWHDRQIMQLRQGKTDKRVAIPMHPLWVAEIDKLPRRAVTMLYDRTGKPFSKLVTLRERIMDVLHTPSVRAAVAEAKQLGEHPAGASLVPHGLRKNAACHLVELGLTDEEAGALAGMNPEMVRHYSKRKSVYLIAQRVAERVTGATIIGLPGPRAAAGGK